MGDYKVTSHTHNSIRKRYLIKHQVESVKNRKLYWSHKATNEEVRKRADIEHVSTTTMRRRRKWLGHVLRITKTRHANIAITRTHEGKRKR